MTEPVCPACGRAAPPSAAFCPGCGASLIADGRADPDATVATTLPPVSEAIGQYAGEKFGGAMHRLRGLVPRQTKIDNRVAAVIALAGGLLAGASTYLPWIQIEVAGRSGPGSLATGLGGRDGLTVLVVGGLAAVIGVLLLLGRGDAWLKLGLFVAGGIVTIIGVVDIVDVHNKAEALERRFGVGEGVVTASAGIGLWAALAAGVALLAGGLLARRAQPAPAPEPAPADQAGQLSRIT
jgi:hypothetical protein